MSFGYIIGWAAMMAFSLWIISLDKGSGTDGSRDAVFFIRRCGASAEYRNGVAIVPKGQPLADKPGDVFIFGHQVNLTARWSAADTLIVVSPSANPSPQETRVGGVTIMYKRP